MSTNNPLFFSDSSIIFANDPIERLHLIYISIVDVSLKFTFKFRLDQNDFHSLKGKLRSKSVLFNYRYIKTILSVESLRLLTSLRCRALAVDDVYRSTNGSKGLYSRRVRNAFGAIMGQFYFVTGDSDLFFYFGCHEYQQNLSLLIFCYSSSVSISCLVLVSLKTFFFQFILVHIHIMSSHTNTLFGAPFLNTVVYILKLYKGMIAILFPVLHIIMIKYQ